MKEFNKYFIIGTNSDALHDTMNGTVTGELIRCNDCRHAHMSAFNPEYKRCDYTGNIKSPQDYCSWAERRNPDV